MERSKRVIRALDVLTIRLRLHLSTGRRIAVFISVYVFYVLALALTVDAIGVSTNYFVLLPLFTAAALFGWYGGIVFGLLALPSNLLWYYLLGALDAAPAHPMAALISGILTGIVIGYFSDFFGRLQLATDENRFLVQELHHRVKNNLGIISGLIQYHSMAVIDPTAHRNLQQLKRRVHSIAALHDRLYRHDERTDTADRYLRDLVRDIEESLVGDHQSVNFVFDLHPLQFDPDELMSMGLITNEFITNSIEHAFPQGSGQITLSLQEGAEGIVYELTDNGRGLPQGFTVDGSGTLGFSLMRSLATRVRGRLEIDGRNGTTVRLLVPRRQQ